MPEKSLAQKLFLKSGQTAVFVNPPKGFLASMSDFPTGVAVLENPDRPVDFIQLFVANRKELEAQLPRLKTALKPNGLLWITYYKGTSHFKTDINRDSIFAYALTLGLQGVAMISIDEDWSAGRFKLIK
jgi:hypothetical protein